MLNTYNQVHDIDTEGDHEYELVDRYTQPRQVNISEASPTKQQKSLLRAEDYEFTQCPAYDSVAHGNQQTSTHHYASPAPDASGGIYEPVDTVSS